MVQHLIQLSKIILASTVFLLAQGCGQGTDVFVPIPADRTQCATGTAQILVGNGFLQNLCGCAGPGEDRTIYPSPGNLTCHLESSEGRVFFNFSNTNLDHQIVPTAQGPAFPPTPYVRPNAVGDAAHLFMVTLPDADTTYPFVDAVSGMKGQIFVPSSP